MKRKALRLSIPAAVLVLSSLSCDWLPHLRQALQFTPGTLPDASLGIPYEVEIAVTQNDTPVMNFSLSTGALPA